MITVSMLGEAFQKLEQMGKEELSFTMSGVRITLRNLTATEEVMVQKYAQEALDPTAKDTDQAAAMDFLDRFKNALLSYAIVEIDGQDLRSVQYVETAERTSTGMPVKVTKEKAIRDLVNRWPRALVLAIFDKYGELSATVEKNAQLAMSVDASDIDAEIERLQERIGELERRKAAKVDSALEKVATIQKAAAEEVAARNARIQQREAERAAALAAQREAEEAAQREAEEAAFFAAQQQEQQPTIKQHSGVTAAQPPQQPILPTRKVPVQTPTQRIAQPSRLAEDVEPLETTPYEQIRDSMLSDPEVEVERENQRLAALRQQRNMPLSGRIPPHLVARQAATQIEQIENVNGLEAYRMPQQEVVSQAPPSQQPPVVDSVPRGNVNPRFVPPHRR